VIPPIVDRDGKSIGWVTSCAIDGDRFITGLAYLEFAYTAEGTPIFVRQGAVMDRPATAAKVVSRFAKL
jgi:glycine hydroxymethyltransferase